MPTTEVFLVTAPEETYDGDACIPVGIGATPPRRVACSTFVELARLMGIRTDDAIRQYVDLR